MIVEADAEAWPLFLPSQQGAQSATDHRAEYGEVARVGVLEVADLTAQHRIQVGDDALEAIAPRAVGLGPDAVFEFGQVLLANVAVASAKPVAEGPWPGPEPGSTPCPGTRQSPICLIAGCSVRPFPLSHSRTIASAACASSRERHRIRKSSAERTSGPCWLATTHHRNGFDILRAARSPRAALHPASPHQTLLWLMSGDRRFGSCSQLCHRCVEVDVERIGEDAAQEPRRKSRSAICQFVASAELPSHDELWRFSIEAMSANAIVARWSFGIAELRRTDASTS
ncbi:MAG TPA: hypothetical protein PK264_22445 [Hyphomicrobiaceae bacterium]|nr:hypothetical protein [Hyphomicrobiaceae bacterium]